MSELFDKEVNAQKENLKKILPGFTQAHASSRKPTIKVCDENETKKKKKTTGA